MLKMVKLVSISAAEAFSQTDSHAQSRDRSSVPQKHKWNLSDIFPSNDAWMAAKQKYAGRINEVTRFKGTVAKSASHMLECLEFTSNLNKELSRLFNYASMKSDEDTRDSRYLSMKQEMSQIFTDYNAKAAFIEPEILTLDKKAIEAYIAENRELNKYEMYLSDLFRKKKHKLSEKEENIIAEAGLMANGAYNIYNIFSNAELPYPEVTLSDGRNVTIDQAGYSLYRAFPDRNDRENVFQAFWGALRKFKGTFGEQLYANVKKDMFYSRSRGYGSSLESALDENNIPTEVYMSLIKNVNENLNTFHRYMKLKKRMLNVDQLKYSDLYVPVVKGVDLKYSIEEAQKYILEAFKPLGPDYCSIIKKAFADRWIDVFPTTAKRSGAYCNDGGYDVHPYILLNYNGKYDDVSTLAHELGHAMHSYYSNKTQPYPTADYSIFVAEVASTFNEALLIDTMLKKIKDDDVRLSLLMSYLDGFKGTLFRQTQFAEFDLRIHQKAEKGEALTGGDLTKLYSDIVKKYYGHDEGICIVDDLYTVEWAFIPHFYYNFYVYQYATSFTASTALAERVLNNEPGAVEAFIDFLSAGGSDYPIEILKNAGVDMTNSAPFDKAIIAMNTIIDEIEKILDKK